MSNPTSNQTNNRLILTVYLLFVLFLALLLALTSYSYESNLSTKDIDKLIKERWDENKLKPSEQSSDEEFIRRLYLDVSGRVPTTDEVKTFLNDDSSEKRKNKIDELLNSEEFGQNMADIWISILFTQDNRKRVPPYIYTMIKDKFSDHFNRGRPYTEFVYSLLSAEGLATTNPAVLFTARFETPEDAAGSTMKIFMGKQIQCAQCHHHPYEDITQEDFYGVAAFFARKNTLPLYKKDQADKISKALSRYEKLIDRARQKELEMNTEANDEMSDEMKNMPEHENAKKKDKSKVQKKKRKVGIPPKWAIDTLKNKISQKEFVPDLLVWDAVNGQMQYEVKGEKKSIGPKYLGGPSASSEPGVDRRKLLASFLTTIESKQLAKEFVNRFWKYFFGYGFVNPIDDFTDKNSGNNPELLDLLAEEFVRTNFDIKHLFQLILNSETYQLSSTPNSTNKDDHEYFSRAVLRPMTPVQLTNALFTVSGYFNTNNVKNKNQDELEKIKFRVLKLFVYTFEDDEMNEVEDFSGTISQALLLMNSDLAEKVTEKKAGNRVSEILRDLKDPSDRIDAIYLGTFSRYPTIKEKNELLNKAGNNENFYEDLQWALLNSSEFIFNH
jgi:uncharacterized protein DUF1549/uncharacterized protein DUF1553